MVVRPCLRICHCGPCSGLTGADDGTLAWPKKVWRLLKQLSRWSDADRARRRPRQHYRCGVGETKNHWILAYNVAIAADSGALTAGVGAVARADEQDATLAIYSLVGFIGGAIGPMCW